MTFPNLVVAFLHSAAFVLCVITVLLHFWIGLPAMKNVVFVVIYSSFALIGLWKSASVEHRGRSVALMIGTFVLILLMPVVGTYAIGSHRFGNLKQAGPEEHDDPSDPRERRTADGIRDL